VRKGSPAFIERIDGPEILERSNPIAEAAQNPLAAQANHASVQLDGLLRW
jgi:hypothetical protein